MDRLNPTGDSRPDFLVVLGLLPPCSAEDVHRAYKARVAELHPDHGGSLPEFLKLQHAYEQAQDFAKLQEGRLKWLATQVEQYVQQQAIVSEVELRGGRVEIEHLAWMQRSFGEFAILAERLRGIVLRDCAAADELLQYLAEQASRLRHLRDIDLARSLVSDAGLESLCELRGLERINLEGTLVTEAGVVGLSALPELKWINLGNTPLRWWTRWQLARNYPRLTFAKKAHD